MAFMLRAVAALALLLLLMTGTASAQQTWSVMVKMGVPGTWAAPCSEEANPSNWFITYYNSGGRALRRADRGATEPALNSTIDSAQTLTATTFLMRIRNDDPKWGSTDGHTFDTVIEITPRGMRTLASTRIGDGKQFIKDGKFTSNGNPAVTFQRCK